MEKGQAETAVFASVKVTRRDIFPALKDALSVRLEGCNSKQWRQIMQALASLPRLEALSILNCPIGNDNFQPILSSRSITSLRIGTQSPDILDHCGLHEEGVRSLAKLKELKSLAIGTSCLLICS